MPRAQVFALGGIALMVAGAACGAAERRTARPPQPLPQPPAPQPYPPQGHNPQQGYTVPQGHNFQQGYTAPQAYNPQQGYTVPYPPGQNH